MFLFLIDPEVYDVFANIFNPVIAEYHKVEIILLQSVHDLGDADKLEDMPVEYAENIVSTRVRVGRTVKGFPMASKLTRDVISNVTRNLLGNLNLVCFFFYFNLKQRLELETTIKEALFKLDGDLAGTYKSLSEMSYDERNRLIDEHILYNDADDK